MMNKKILRQIFFPVIILGSLLFLPNVENLLSTVHAEIKMYSGTGESSMSDIETADIVKLRAREKAIQSATEKAGVALVSYSRTLNNVLTDDEISAITATKYELVGEPSYKRKIQQLTDETTAVIWSATVNVNVDDEEIQNWLNLDEKEKATLINRVKENKKTDTENDKIIEDLRKKYWSATTDAEKEKIKAAFQEADKKYLAIKKFNEGNYFSYDKQKAIQCYTEAINLNSNFAEAYFKRGEVYYYSYDEYKTAVENFTAAIQIKPNYAEAYYLRGNVYYSLDDNIKALEDLSKAIKLKPNYAAAYAERGLVYYFLEDYQKAIEDYTSAIQIQPKNEKHYEQRGKCYEKLGDTEKARADFQQYEYWKNR